MSRAAQRRWIDPLTGDYEITEPEVQLAPRLIGETFRDQTPPATGAAIDYYVAADGELPGSTTMTLAALFRYDSTILFANTLFANVFSASGWELRVNSSGQAPEFFIGSPLAFPGSRISGGGPLVAGSLNAIVATYDGSAQRLFLNGALVASASGVSFDPCITFGVDASIGARDDPALPGVGPCQNVTLFGVAYSDTVALDATAAAAMSAAMQSQRSIIAIDGGPTYRAPGIWSGMNLSVIGSPTAVEVAFGSDRTVTPRRLRRDSTHASTVVFLLRLRRGSCPVAPELGNDLFNRLDRLDTDDGAEARAARWCRDALAPLTRDRRISNLDIEVTIDGDRIEAEVAFDDPPSERNVLRVDLSRGA